MNRELPKHGEIWKHFKHKYYQIICVGHHSETKERMVVYQPIHYTLYGTFMQSFSEEPCISPLDMFMSEVDHVKYPDVKQMYRFIKVQIRKG